MQITVDHFASKRASHDCLLRAVSSLTRGHIDPDLTDPFEVLFEVPTNELAHNE